MRKRPPERRAGVRHPGASRTNSNGINGNGPITALHGLSATCLVATSWFVTNRPWVSGKAGRPADKRCCK
jgi:hypothetical protein